MTEEEKLLVFKDLSARLPYGVKMKVTLDLSYDTSYDSVEQHCDFDATLYAINIDGDPTDILIYHEDEETANYLNEQFTECPDILEDFVPYLRPMSNMTEEEIEEYIRLQHKYCIGVEKPTHCCKNSIMAVVVTLTSRESMRYWYNNTVSSNTIDFLNEHYLDWRGLIPLGLALEAPDNMYN